MSRSCYLNGLHFTGSVKGEERKVEVSEAVEDQVLHTVRHTDHLQQE